MTLQWTARLFVDVDDFPIGIAWQVNIIIDLYLCHFFIDLCLNYGVSTAHIYIEVIQRTFFSALDFLM
jgi:hypothetical protein